VKVPLPNLDDRRWADLADEARSVIPFYAPDWTDHNVHDPGITLMELFAWLAEMDIYELNRIPELHKRKFLALVGITPRPPQPARTTLAFGLRSGATPRELRVDTELTCKDPFGDETGFRLLESVTIVEGGLRAIQLRDSRGFRDVSAQFQRGEPVALFGEMPSIGMEFYLGFTNPFPKDVTVSLGFIFDGEKSSLAERLALIEEAKRRGSDCRRSSTCDDSSQTITSEQSTDAECALRLNRVRVTWEAYVESTPQPSWVRLDEKSNQICDDTRTFTLDGRVQFTLPKQMRAVQLGRIQTPLFYLRCRLEAGAFDAAPVASKVIFNAASAEQSIRVVGRWIIEPGTAAQGVEPTAGEITRFVLKVDERGHIIGINFQPVDETSVRFQVLEYTKATSTKIGSLIARTIQLPNGNGWPNQLLELPESPVEQASFRLYSEEAGEWRRWRAVEDFTESTRRDADFVLDPTIGQLQFGDGEKGRALPQDSKVFATYRATRADGASIPSATSFKLSDSAINRIHVEDFDGTRADIASTTNVEAARGAKAESIDEATGRAIDLLNSTTRAVTLADYESLAMKTPGARIARVDARANQHPDFACLKAPGVVSLVVVPDQRGGKPVPAQGLLEDVAAYLNPRRVIGTRLFVTGPQYLSVTVRATVKALSGTNKTNLKSAIVEGLDQLFDPISGGPNKTGWPFGRDVYRSEVMQTIDEIAGVDHVISLELIGEGCAPQCGNICVAPGWLVASGSHEIEVL
jgi:hypothetical protein